MRQKIFLIISALGEAIFGLCMLAATPLMLAFFLGNVDPTAAMLWLGRGFGATLVACAFAGWLWRVKAGPRAQPPLARAVVAYDVLATLTLVFVGLVLGQVGIGLWPAVIVHSLLGAWGALDWRRGRAPN